MAIERRSKGEDAVPPTDRARNPLGALSTTHRFNLELGVREPMDMNVETGDVTRSNATVGRRIADIESNPMEPGRKRNDCGIMDDSVLPLQGLYGHAVDLSLEGNVAETGLIIVDINISQQAERELRSFSVRDRDRERQGGFIATIDNLQAIALRLTELFQQDIGDDNTVGGGTTLE